VTIDPDFHRTQLRQIVLGRCHEFTFNADLHGGEVITRQSRGAQLCLKRRNLTIGADLHAEREASAGSAQQGNGQHG